MDTPKPAFIIPSWKLSSTDISYRNIAAALRKEGYEVLGHDISWQSHTLTQWTAGLVGALRAQQSPATVYAFGTGTMIALAAAARVPMARLVLCSPRGYFKEYLPQCTPGDMRWIGDARFAEFRAVSGREQLDNLQAASGSIIIDEAELIGRVAHKHYLDDIIESTGWDVKALRRQRYGVMSPGYQDAVVETIRGV